MGGVSGVGNTATPVFGTGIGNTDLPIVAGIGNTDLPIVAGIGNTDLPIVVARLGNTAVGVGVGEGLASGLVTLMSALLHQNKTPPHLTIHISHFSPEHHPFHTAHDLGAGKRGPAGLAERRVTGQRPLVLKGRPRCVSGVGGGGGISSEGWCEVWQ
ncbi:hypothetical protein Pmani_039120 [Petrolisthes manimaculis]|uniref:Uncharacterized protein n=1 Tax=Petrolisthes manimaculis TaxID=1843537 RepID=A0AAE1NET0_9EUCA|nr:hypothetical protein Pmani_039120 [Petrolisthes manimaculis]